jgi:hypothetical protein
LRMASSNAVTATSGSQNASDTSEKKLRYIDVGPQDALS